MRFILRLVESPVPVLVAVRGQCLGGGLELALAGTLIFAASGARLGQPEIKLGVIAPAASCLLPERIGRAQAEELLLSGRSCPAAEALALGLVTHVERGPRGCGTRVVRPAIWPTRAGRRCAVRCARLGSISSSAVRAKLARVEELYLEDVMSTRDALEGLEAFLAKRPARWEHR